MARIIKVLRAGLMKYGDSLKLQQLVAKRHHQNLPFETLDTIIITEHHPVYTIGIRTKDYTAEDETKLKNLGAEFYRTNRGGLITFHGPGQLVAYPIVNLKNYKASVRWYVSHIEETVVRMCESLEIKAETSPHTGVWVNDKKICAVGIHASRYVTSHGLALNCNTDLTWFDHVTPCGIVGKGVTSLSQQLGRDVTVEETVLMFLKSFGDVFECELTDMSEDEIIDVLKLI